MTRDEFAQIAKKIESVYRQKFNDLQFDEWWESFGKEDFNVALRAFRKMKEEYNYFPVVATFRSYIEGVKEIDKSAQKESKTQKLGEPTPQDLDRYIRWVRFIRWTVETRNFPKTSSGAFKMKAEFEEKHPDWKPSPRKMEGSSGFQTIGESLKGTLGFVEP